MRSPRILVLDDGNLADQVRQVLSAAGAAPEVVACRDRSTLPEVFREGRTFHLVVAGPIMAGGEGVARLQVIAEELPEASIVLAFESRPDVAIRDLVRVGAVDLLVVPVEDSTLADALVRALSLAREPANEEPETGVDHPVMQTVQPRDDANASPPPTPVLTVVSATGAAGRTTVAVNLATYLAQLGHRVGLLDLDLVFGDTAARLGVGPVSSVSAALDAPGGRLQLLDHAVEARPGLWLLAAPRDPSAVEAVDGAAVDRLLEAAAATWDVVVVDTTPALAGTTLAAVDRSQRLVVVALPDPAGLRDLRSLLDRLRRQRVPAERIRLILNRTGEGDGEPVDGAVSVPESAEVAKAEARREPVLVAAPRAPVSRALGEAFAPLVPAAPPEVPAPRRTPRLRRRRQ